MKLIDAKQPIAEALQRLADAPKELGAFVIIEDTVTDRFVQFATDKDTGGLLIDLPDQQLDDEARGRAFDMLSRRKAWGNGAGASYQYGCALVSDATEVALRVLRELLRLPDISELRIVEDETDHSEEPAKSWHRKMVARKPN